MARDQLTQVLASTDEIQLSVTDPPSDRETSRPVWFVQEGERLFLLPVRGSESYWFRTVSQNPTVSLTVGGTTRSAQATPIKDPMKVQEIVDRFRSKYGADQVRQYYSKLDVAVEVPLD